jgi:hypothetical protein
MVKLRGLSFVAVAAVLGACGGGDDEVPTGPPDPAASALEHALKTCDLLESQEVDFDTQNMTPGAMRDISDAYDEALDSASAAFVQQPEGPYSGLLGAVTDGKVTWADLADLAEENGADPAAWDEQDKRVADMFATQVAGSAEEITSMCAQARAES